jgi:hypothetical protein
MFSTTSILVPALRDTPLDPKPHAGAEPDGATATPLVWSIHDYAALWLWNPDRPEPLTFRGYEYLTRPLDDAAPRIVIQKAAQVGATVMAAVRAIWFVDVFAGHTLYLFPTHAAARRFCRGRLRVLIERSPYLRSRFRTCRDQHLQAGDVNLYCHGGRSRTEVMSVPVQYLTLDEQDEMYQSRPDLPRPWSAVDLARQRLSGQRWSWELHLSTPTIPDHGIAAEFARSDQQHYHPRCPRCCRYVRLTWPEALLWQRVPRGEEPAAPGQPRRYRVSFCCPRCRQPWDEAERRQAIRDGRWIADYPSRSLRGYHLSQLLSPTQSPGRLAQAWIEAQGKPTRMQVFFNAVLGLPYTAEGARLDASWIEAAQVRGGGWMQSQASWSVMGADVGPAGLHVVIAVPQGDLLCLLWVGLVRDWPELAQLVRRFGVRCYVLDALPETHAARRFLRDFLQGYLCWYTQAGQTIRCDPDARTVHAPRTDSLDAMFLRWRLGKVSAPRDLPAEFVRHLTAPVRVLRLNAAGVAVADYLAAGPDHFAHAMNYCELALALLPRPLRFEIHSPGAAAPAWQT